MKTMQKRPTRPLAVALMLLLGFVLSGCMAVNIDMEIDKDLKLSGTWQYTFDRKMLEEQTSQYGGYGSTSTDYESDIDKSVKEAQAEAPEGATVEKISTDSDLGMKVTLDKVDPNALDSQSDTGMQGLSISEDNGEITFSMPNFIRSSDLGTGGAAEYTSGGDPSDMFTEAQVKLTFPGDVIDAPGGEIDGKVVTYDLKKFDGDTITVKAKKSNFPWWILFVIGGILLLLLIAGGILLAVMLSRKKKRQPHAGAPATAAGYGVPGQQNPYGQPGPYGQQPGQQPGHPGTGASGPGQYGQPGPQGQPGPHNQPGPYGQPQPGHPGAGASGPGQYGQPGTQGQPGPHSQPGPYGQPPHHGSHQAGRAQPPQAPGSAPGPHGGSQPQWGQGQPGQQPGQPGYGQPGPDQHGYGHPGYGSGPQPPRQ